MRGETQRVRDWNERCINPPYAANPFPGHTYTTSTVTSLLLCFLAYIFLLLI